MVFIIDYSVLEPLDSLKELTIEAPFFTDLNFVKGMPLLTSLEILGNGNVHDDESREYEQ